ncbi:MAG TPA: class I SAM-dependent methyltransferase [Acidimicrobiales bacterium]|nr:class I SAM-dependent methyltransferase [Acidimicrobiales bacterium]
MTTGDLVVHDPGRMTFQLRPAYAMALARGLGVGEPMSGMCQHVGWLAKVEDLVVECFRKGGGVSFETFGQVVWGSDATTEPYDLDTVDPMTVDDVLSLLPDVARRLESGIDVADVGCGGGWQLNLLARRFPASRFVGYDLLDRSLEPGRRVARSLGLTNVRFEQKDAATVDGSEKFDFITTFDAIHDQARPDLALRGIAKSLRAGGTYIGVDVSGSSTLANNLRAPLAVFKYTWSVLYCMTSSLAYNGMGLGGMWGEELAQKMMREAGFTSVKTVHLPANLINCYHIATVA